MTQPSQPAPDTSRRAALAGLGLAGLAATLTACGGSSSSSTGSTATGAATGADSGTALGPASDVPVGGGKVFASAQVVVTQPSAGEFKAFSAVCTHGQCIVDQVADGTIDCPCHGSRFHLDGTVARGPAPRALPARPVTVVDGQLVLS